MYCSTIGLAFSVSVGFPAGLVKRPALHMKAFRIVWIFSKTHSGERFSVVERSLLQVLI